MKVGIPALAGLSVLHGLVPPHPGPLTAIGLLDADLGRTLIFGIIIAIPTVIVAGPILARFVDQWVPKSADDLSLFGTRSEAGVAGGATTAGLSDARVAGTEDARSGGVAVDTRDAGDRDDPQLTGSPTDRADLGDRVEGRDDLDRDRDDGPDGPDGRYGSFDEPLAPGRKRVGFATAIIGITLPVVLMLVDAITKLLVTDEEAGVRQTMDFIGTPIVALLVAVIYCYIALGLGSGLDKGQVSDSVGSALPAIASIILIVAAGGGFKQTLIDAGVGNVIKDWAEGVNISVLVLGWLVAVLIRLGTGSATVATITAAGIVAPLAPQPVGRRTWPCWCSPSGAGRCSSPTSTTPGSGSSRSTSGSPSGRRSSRGRSWRPSSPCSASPSSWWRASSSPSAPTNRLIADFPPERPVQCRWAGEIRNKSGTGDAPMDGQALDGLCSSSRYRSRAM